jgi:uncharacterized membrane protein YidH (DUF202 family)
VNERDPGLQRERTAMAWSRTGLAMLINALVVVRAGTQGGDAIVTGLGGVLVGSAIAAVAFGFWRARRLAQGANPATPVVLVVATVVVTWLACAAGVASVLIGVA